MKTLTCLATITLMALSPAALFAGNGNGKGKNKSKLQVERVAPQTGASYRHNTGHCPPGLAKKAIPCVPPGQAKKLYRTGDYIGDNYRWINDPYRYGLRRSGHYVRAGDYVYSIDPETHKVLNLIGAVADILY